MITEDSLIDEFKFMGVENLGTDIIIKCMELAAKHKLDAERFVEEWVAFSQTKLGGNLQPTIINLDAMARKQLLFEKKQNKNLDKTKSETITPAANKIKVYNSNKSSDSNDIRNIYNDGSFPAMWTDQTPKKTVETERRYQEKLEDISNFSPASYNPEVTKPSTSYAERTDGGTEVEVFGPEALLEQDSLVAPKDSDHIEVKFLGNYDAWSSSSSRYMFESQEVEAMILNNRIETIGTLLREKYITHENNNFLTYGRICCDGDRLNAYSILLQTSLQHGKGESPIVNLQQIPKLALFPGQIILLHATLSKNAMRQTYLLAEHMYYNLIPELPEQKPKIESNPIKIIAASGPFTLSDNLVYQPLQDLIKYVLANQPHILILFGPFVDMRHSSVADGTMAETYRTHFENLMEQITTPLRDTKIQVVVVPSTLDAHHHSVYPTPPFETSNKSRFNSKQVHMASDPSMISFNNLVVGVTSADILFHLAKTEFNHSPYNKDRMARFAEHILSQRSFYPIHPPQQPALDQHRLSIDQQLMRTHGEFDVMPHILILPSSLKYFVKSVYGCVVINPERLSKGFVGGTFASINVYPGQIGSSVEQNITCRIIKI